MQENSDLRSAMAQVAGSAAIAGVLMVVVGFKLNCIAISSSALYNHATDLFYWTMRVGGIAMLAIAVTAYVGVRLILAVDTIMAVGIGLVMVGVALIWLMNDDVLDGILSLLFGSMFIRSGLQSWAIFRTSSVLGPMEVASAPSDSAEDQPVSSEGISKGMVASLREARKKVEKVDMPKPDEPTPEGFLADLGRTSEEEKG